MSENPIDKDKITETPSNIKYPHHIGSASVTPLDKIDIKSRAMSAMEQQTNTQLDQIKKQMELLANQAREIQDRINLSNEIYKAEANFEPLINHTYYLYENTKGSNVLSMIGPDEWGKSCPFPVYLCTCQLLADHTWKILHSA